MHRGSKQLCTIKQVERFNEKVKQHLRLRLAKQDEIFLNDSTSWVDIGVEEVAISQHHTNNRSKPGAWAQCLGIVKRGHPESLILAAMPGRHTGLHATGPSPLLPNVWEKLSNQYITTNKGLLIHTDSAQAYQNAIHGTIHTSITQQMRESMESGQTPQLACRDNVDLQDGSTLTASAGAKVVDGIRCVIKPGIKNIRCNSNLDLVDKLVRMAPRRYWH